MKPLIRIGLLLWLATTTAGAWGDSPAELLFPTPFNSEPDKTGPMPAEEAAARMQLPSGFRASVFASEPDVQNPIAMTWDGRGRLWVAENYTYAESPQNLEMKLRDRVLIFEDSNHSGRFSSRKVFTDQLQVLTSIEVGRGGVWAMCPPRLLFIPCKPGSDAPEGPPQTVLDGFTMPAQNHHNFANGLKWGPDGWLYGRCGHSAPGEIGAPGTQAEQRIPLRGAIWRYHPQRKVFESISSGTTNPWGHDWDEHGELFFINTVNGHLWHQITGAHYMVSGGNAHTYALIDQHADHWHFDTSQSWTKSRNGGGDAFGGGHAHVGMMIYQADNWPAEYRGKLFTFNMHGYRANQEILERMGSGYVGHHGQDFLFVADKWFRGIDLGYGPDGSVFALDWSDTGECHESTGVHRTSGRIFRIAYGKPAQADTRNLETLTSAELVELHRNSNEWYVRQARRILADRAEGGADMGPVAVLLHQAFDHEPSDVQKLRVLWTLYAIGAADKDFLVAQLGHENEHVRAWAIRLLTDHWPLDTTESRRPAGAAEADKEPLLPRLIELAGHDTSGLVRLVLASTLQRLPISQRPALAAALAGRAEDAQDHNLPLLIWYGLIPVGDAHPELLPAVASSAQLPMTRKLIARRLAEDIERTPAALAELLSLATNQGSSAMQVDVAAGMAEGLTGWHVAPRPAGWDAFSQKLKQSADTATAQHVRDLNVLFGDASALAEVEKVACDDRAASDARQNAMQALIDHRAPGLKAICQQLLSVPGLTAVAARGLATFDSPDVGRQLIDACIHADDADRPALVAALTSRPNLAMLLLDAVAAESIPKALITAVNARQIRNLDDAKLSKRLTEVWGDVRETGTEKRKHIAALKMRLTAAALKKADKKHGQIVFSRVCAVCHTLNGEGAKIGPDLTGSNRDNLDYLLENIVDPSAVVPAEYRVVVVRLKDDRVISGIVAARTERTLTLRTITETITVELSEVARLKESAESMMPEGLLEAQNENDVRDLIGYLMFKGASAKR